MPTFETNQPIELSIEISQGAVHIIASDRTDTVVAVNPSDRDRPQDVEAAAKTVVDLINGILTINGPKARGVAAHLVGWKRSGSVDVTVELPERSRLRADTGFANFRGDGRLDEVEVKTGAGDVQLDQTGGAASAQRSWAGVGRGGSGLGRDHDRGRDVHRRRVRRCRCQEPQRHDVDRSSRRSHHRQVVQRRLSSSTTRPATFP